METFDNIMFTVGMVIVVLVIIFVSSHKPEIKEPVKWQAEFYSIHQYVDCVIINVRNSEGGVETLPCKDIKIHSDVLLKSDYTYTMSYNENGNAYISNVIIKFGGVILLDKNYTWEDNIWN